MIKESAIKRTSDGKIWTGKRHGHAMKIMRGEGIQEIEEPEYIHGFMTHDGKFVDRKEAFIIAMECEQFLDPSDPWSPPTLMSEDII